MVEPQDYYTFLQCLLWYSRWSHAHIPIFSLRVWCNCWCWGVFIVYVLVVLIPLTVSNTGCESVSCIFALVWKAKEAATEGENGLKWNILKVLSVQAIRVGNLEVVICTSGFKCPELGCTRVSPRLCLLFTAGVRSVWRSEDVYTMTHIRQTCTFTQCRGPPTCR